MVEVGGAPQWEAQESLHSFVHSIRQMCLFNSKTFVYVKNPSESKHLNYERGCQRGWMVGTCDNDRWKEIGCRTGQQSWKWW